MGLSRQLFFRSSRLYNSSLGTQSVSDFSLPLHVLWFSLLVLTLLNPQPRFCKILEISRFALRGNFVLAIIYLHYILILANNIFCSTIAQIDVQLILKSSRVSASVCLHVRMQGGIAWPSLSYNITKTYPPSSYFCRLNCDSLTDPDFLFGGNSANRENLVLIMILQHNVDWQALFAASNVG